jgi:hypothetical protein
MKNSAFLILVLGILTCRLQAQGVKISPTPGTPDPSAILETQDSTRGVLMPRVNLQNLTDAVTIANPATSLMVFNTGTTLAPAGFYYNAGTPQAPQWALVLPNPANTALNMNGFAIENLATPVNPADAVTKDYVDNQIINVSGSGGGACHCPSMITDEFAATTLTAAMRNCAALVQGGHSDWYLPELEDLTYFLSFEGANLPNDNSSNYLWTRTRNTSSSNGFAYFNFNNGYFYYTNGLGNYHYRCVR